MGENLEDNKQHMILDMTILAHCWKNLNYHGYWTLLSSKVDFNNSSWLDENYSLIYANQTIEKIGTTIQIINNQMIEYIEFKKWVILDIKRIPSNKKEKITN
jgi:hypothetical protein